MKSYLELKWERMIVGIFQKKHRIMTETAGLFRLIYSVCRHIREDPAFGEQAAGNDSKVTGGCCQVPFRSGFL
jgi:hypothetical protein